MYGKYGYPGNSVAKGFQAEVDPSAEARDSRSLVIEITKASGDTRDGFNAAIEAFADGIGVSVSEVVYEPSQCRLSILATLTVGFRRLSVTQLHQSLSNHLWLVIVSQL